MILLSVLRNQCANAKEWKAGDGQTDLEFVYIIIARLEVGIHLSGFEIGMTELFADFAK